MIMKLFAITSILTLTALGMFSCATIKNIIETKPAPIYVGVDKDIKPYVDEYMKLSAQNNITFTHPVTIGFTTIKSGNVIGYCSYGSGWREIDLDSGFWGYASEIRKKALVFHELTHCYCDRDHDFKQGSKYPSATLRFLQKLQYKMPWYANEALPGYFDDTCPTSVMHPIIVSDWCTEQHWNHYIKEMFERCDPY